MIKWLAPVLKDASSTPLNHDRFFLAKALLARSDSVVGIDNLNHYYNPVLCTRQFS